MNMKRYRNKPISDPSSLSNAVEQTTHIQRVKVTFIISQVLKQKGISETIQSPTIIS